MELSIVIIAKNEAAVIANTLQSARGISDDIIVVDSGSTDGTTAIALQQGARVLSTGWEGYGKTKNKGSDAARYDWILSLDADEAIDETLRNSIAALKPGNEETLYQFKRRNYYCGREIRFGEWGMDKVRRIYNRKKLSWNEDDVHEQLQLTNATAVIKIKGSLLHYTAKDRKSYEAKTDHYARLGAKKYAGQGIKAGPVKRWLAPVTSFLNNYLLRLGFLDGKPGYIIAINTARYTFLKYKYLAEGKC